VNALDAAKLDVGRRRRAGDERQRSTLSRYEIVEDGGRLGYQLDDLVFLPDDADVQIGYAPRPGRSCRRDL
jgi:hypothetical protein